MRYLMLGTAAVCAAILITSWHVPLRQSKISLPQTEVATKNPAADSITSSSSAITLSELSLGLKDLRRQYQNTDNVAAFIQKALSEPERGGFFYARTAYERCKAVSTLAKLFDDLPRALSQNSQIVDANLVKSKSELADQINLEAKRCKDVDMLFPEVNNFYAAIKDTRRIPAELPLAAMRISCSGFTRDECQEALRKALDLEDPNVIAQLSFSLFSKQGQVRFNGTVLSENDSHLLMTAWALVGCDLGTDCRLSQYRMCLQSQDLCGLTYKEVLEKQLSKKEFEKLLVFQEAVLNSVAKKNLSVFN
jgi:hypothetical protein